MRAKSDFFIDVNETIFQAIAKLNEVVPQNIYVLDGEERLVGSISDGDIRRGILGKCDYFDKVDKIMHKNLRTIHFKDTDKEELIKKFTLLGLSSVPVVDAGNRVLEIVFLKKDPPHLKLKSAKDNFVFILAGGRGARLGPLTNVIPKPLIPIGNSPILEKIMDKFTHDGFNKFILSLNYKAEMIKLYFDTPEIKNKYQEVKYVEEKKPLGTIGSLYLAKKYLTDDFLISNADIIIKDDFEEILKFHQAKNAVLTIVGCVKETVIPYGVLNTLKSGELAAIQEKPSFTNLINTGIYAANPEFLNYIEENVYADMTQAIERLLAAKKKIAVYQTGEEQWFDIGQWDELQKTISFY